MLTSFKKINNNSNQNIIVLAQKQTHGSVEQSREPRNISAHLWAINLGGGKNIKWEQDSFFSKWCWESQPAACKSMKLEHTLISCTKINSKWLRDLHIKHDIIKLLEEIIGKTFSDINYTISLPRQYK